MKLISQSLKIPIYIQCICIFNGITQYQIFGILGCCALRDNPAPQLDYDVAMAQKIGNTSGCKMERAILNVNVLVLIVHLLIPLPVQYVYIYLYLYFCSTSVQRRCAPAQNMRDFPGFPGVVKNCT